MAFVGKDFHTLERGKFGGYLKRKNLEARPAQVYIGRKGNPAALKHGPRAATFWGPWPIVKTWYLKSVEWKNYSTRGQQNRNTIKLDTTIGSPSRHR